MSPVVELALAVAAGGVLWWLARAVFLPDRTCRWCKGRGTNWWSNAERSGRCWFCGGRPRRMTFGARLVRGKVSRPRWGSKR